MEKAKLLVRETKNKKFEVKLQFENGKTMPLPQLHLKETSLNGSEVEVERQAGKIVLVRLGNKILYPVQTQPPQGAAPKPQRQPGSVSHQQQRQSPSRSEVVTTKQSVTSKDWNSDHISYVRNPAYAPYNFVPLNREVVEVNPTVPPFEKNKFYTNRNGTKIYTGWIEVEIEARTPLYIRGTLTKDEVEAGLESKDKPDFFAPAGRVRIPGSSLRGMVRNMVEMVSFGRFHFFEDRRLYYRGLADRSNLRTEYQNRMSSYDRGARRTQYNFSAGILRKSQSDKKGLHFEIKSSGGNFEQIFKDEARKLVQEIGEKYSPFNFYKVTEGHIVVSGDMPNKKRDWLIRFPAQNAEEIPIPDEDIRDYNNDRTRDERVPNLLELARQSDEKVPCFYVRWQDAKGNDRVSFGHTGMFRLAYEKTIGEHATVASYRIDDQTLNKARDAITQPSYEKLQELNGKEYTPSELASALESKKLKWSEIKKVLQSGAKIDFADAVFGNEHSFAGRVFFEDAFLSELQSDLQLPVATPQVLSTPKPTTFQHYLVQNSDEVRQLNHYNSNTALRGYKFYWHKSGENWIETDTQAVEKHGTQYTRIQPVKQGTKFSGRIRFVNLSDKELGALLFALDLPEGCAHKLGMGKPLGLGSVRLTPRLHLSDRPQRYCDFFAEWDNKIEPSDDMTLESLKRQFEEYVLEKLGEDKNKRLWETERLRELLVMLRVDIGKELETNRRTRYMTIGGQNEFKNRPVLPRASNMLPAGKIEEVLARVRQRQVESVKTDDEMEKAKQDSVKPIQKVSRIKKVVIKGLWDKSDFSWELDPNVNILVGINGSGKTTILELIDHAIEGKYKDVRYAPKEFTITFGENAESKYERRKLVSETDCRILTEFVSTFDKEILATNDEKIKETIDRQLSADLEKRITLLSTERKSIPVGIDLKPHIDELQEIVEDVFKRTEKTLEFVSEFTIASKTFDQIRQAGTMPDGDLEKLQELQVRFKLSSNWRGELEYKKVPQDIIKNIEGIQTMEFNSEQAIENAIKKATGEKHFAEHRDNILDQIIPVNVFKPDSEFLDTLKSRFGKDHAQKLCPVLLKHVEFVAKKPKDFIVLRLQDDQRLIPDLLSAGEKQMLIILLTVLILKIRSLANNNEPCVLIMDEPELSLHLEWQKKLIKYIQRLNEDVQIIIATHSPGIAMEGWLDKTVEMHKIKSRETI